MKKIFVSILFLGFSITLIAQDATELINKTRKKIELVNDYQAGGKMKTNVVFLKVPVSTVSIYFKKPGKLAVKSEKGISFIPKGAVSINLGSIVGSKSDYTIIDAGLDKVAGTNVQVIKLLPIDEESDVILTTLYIDPLIFLIRKAKTTTKANGTYELEMNYGKYAQYGLPDKILLSFNLKDYKLPKGLTFDFDDGNAVAPKDLKNKKGQAEIIFTSYIINKGVSDEFFK